VLGEARLLNIEAKESVAAYEKALALRPNDQTIISVSSSSSSNNNRCLWRGSSRGVPSDRWRLAYRDVIDID
jgi:hypothetical protein